MYKLKEENHKLKEAIRGLEVPEPIPYKDFRSGKVEYKTSSRS
jgi:hypothetical protein